MRLLPFPAWALCVVLMASLGSHQVYGDLQENQGLQYNSRGFGDEDSGAGQHRRPAYSSHSAFITTPRDGDNPCEDCPAGYERGDSPMGAAWCHCVAETHSHPQQCPPGYSWWVNECRLSTVLHANKGVIRTTPYPDHARNPAGPTPPPPTFHREPPQEYTPPVPTSFYPRYRESVQREPTQVTPTQVNPTPPHYPETGRRPEQPPVHRGAPPEEEPPQFAISPRGEQPQTGIGPCSPGLTTTSSRCQVTRVTEEERERTQVHQRLPIPLQCGDGLTLISGRCQIIQTVRESPPTEQPRVEVREEREQHTYQQQQCGYGSTLVSGRCQVTTWEREVPDQNRYNEVIRDREERREVNPVRQPEQPRIDYREREREVNQVRVQPEQPRIDYREREREVNQVRVQPEQPRIDYREREREVNQVRVQPEQPRIDYMEREREVNQVRVQPEQPQIDYREREREREMTQCRPGSTLVSGRCQVTTWERETPDHTPRYSEVIREREQEERREVRPTPEQPRTRVAYQEREREVTQCGHGSVLVSGRCQVINREREVSEQSRYNEVTREREVNQREINQDTSCGTGTGLSQVLGRCQVTRTWEIEQPRQVTREQQVTRVTEEERSQVHHSRPEQPPQVTEVTPCRPGFTMVNGWCEMTRTWEVPQKSRVQVIQRDQHEVSRTVHEQPSITRESHREEQREISLPTITQNPCRSGFTIVNGWCQMTRTWESPEQTRFSEVNRQHQYEAQERRRYSEGLQPKQSHVTRVREYVQHREVPQVQSGGFQVKQCSPGFTMQSGRCQVSYTWERPARRYCGGWVGC